MKRQKFDQEVMYVYKIYCFLTIFLFCTIISLLVGCIFHRSAGLVTFILGFILAYFIMVRKKRFLVPPKKVIARSMSKEIVRNQSFVAIARYASQIYFYLDKPKQAINLLQKYLDSKDPLLSATLADILLREGQCQEALNVLDANPFASDEPLLLLMRGHVLQQINKYIEAIKIYEGSLKLAKIRGFPCNGSTQITRFIQSLSYKASIHHHLGECHLRLHDFKNAQKHYIIGNLHLLDFTLWRKMNKYDTCAKMQK